MKNVVFMALVGYKNFIFHNPANVGIWSEFLLNKINNIVNNYSSNNIGLFFFEIIYHNCRSPPYQFKQKIELIGVNKNEIYSRYIYIGILRE